MMEMTTDYQVKTLLKMVLEILRGSENVEDAIQKIAGLLDEK